MSKSDTKHSLPKKTTSESKVQRCLSGTDKPTIRALSDNSEGSHLVDDGDMRHHSYLQLTELDSCSEDDYKAFQVEALQYIKAINHQIDNLENKIQKLTEMLSTLEPGNRKLTEEEASKLLKSNHEHLGFFKQENQKSYKGKVLPANDIKCTIRPMTTHQGLPLTLDYLFSPNLSKCLKRRVHSQSEEEPEEQCNITPGWNEFIKKYPSSQPVKKSEEKPEEHVNMYLKYKVRQLNLLLMSESSRALNKEWPVQMFHSLWPQKKFSKCDCLIQFRK